MVYFEFKSFGIKAAACFGPRNNIKLADGNRRICLTIHVDDVLVVSTSKDLEWFQENVTKDLTIRVDGPHAQGSGEMLLYLKKRISLLPEGILIQPNGSYIPKLVELLKLGKRRFKGLPHHPTLESYQADQQLQGLLGEAESTTFRSALGLILYIAQDRPDIVFATKVLSTWMSRPCAEAMSAVCHLALYLAGTEEGGVLLRRCESYENVFDRWVEEGEFMEPFGEDRRKRSILNLDVFADSSWGDCHSSRRSISSTIFLNGAYVLNFSRTQATVALSSCEAELYAANAAISEGLFLGRLCGFLVAEVKDGPTEHVNVRLFSDSSAAIGTIQRRGVGRMKHIEIRHLFLQELLRKKILAVSKIGTKQNPADLGTKKLGMDRRRELFQLIGIYIPGVCESDQAFERKQVKKIQNVSARVLQATALTMLQGCSPRPVRIREHQREAYSYVVYILCSTNMDSLCVLHRHLPGVRLHAWSYGAFWRPWAGWKIIVKFRATIGA